MHTTMELLTKALDVKRASHWCRELNLTNAALTQARKRGRLSPTLAGNLAIKLGENPERWIAIAALEAEPKSSLLDSLKEAWHFISSLTWRRVIHVRPKHTHFLKLS